MHCSELLSWLASLLGRRCQWRSKQSNEKSEKPPSLGGAGGGATGSCKAIATCSGAGSVRQGAHFFSQQHSPSAHCAAPRVAPTRATEDACAQLVKGDANGNIDLSLISPLGLILQRVADGALPPAKPGDPPLHLSDRKKAALVGLKVLNARSPHVEQLFGVGVSTMFIDAPQSESPSSSPSLSPSLSPSFSPTESTPVKILQSTFLE